MRTGTRGYPSWPGALGSAKGPDTLRQTASIHQREIACGPGAGHTFFMAQTKPVKPIAYCGAMNGDPAFPFQLHAQFIQGQLTAFRYPGTKPDLHTLIFAVMPAVPLPLRFKRTRLAAKHDQVVHKTRRNTEVARRRPVRVPFVNKINNSTTQLNWRRFAHLRSPISVSDTGNHFSQNMGIPNRINHDML